MTKPKTKALLWLIIPFLSIIILAITLGIFVIVREYQSGRLDTMGSPYGQNDPSYQNDPADQGQY